MTTKALFLDIDGTLVSFHTHQIPDSTVAALTAAKAQGMKLFIATGRPRVLINNLTVLEQRQLIDGYITMNGAYCFVGDEVVYHRSIPTADVETLTTFCAQRHVPCIVVDEHHIQVCQPDARVQQIFYEYLKVTTPIPDTPIETAIRGKAIYQLTPFLTAKQEQEIAPHLTQCESGRWHPAFTDITAAGNTKQHGIDEIIHHFGLRLEDTIAIGDGGNDIGMLQHAGIGIAMGNANPEVQQVANYVTTSVDDHGIAYALQQIACGKWYV